MVSPRRKPAEARRRTPRSIQEALCSERHSDGRCIREARDFWNELFQYDFRIAWVSASRRVGGEEGVHTVALGPSGHTVHANGRKDRESGFNCASDTERARALGAAGGELFITGSLRPLVVSATAGVRGPRSTRARRS